MYTYTIYVLPSSAMSVPYTNTTGEADSLFAWAMMYTHSAAKCVDVQIALHPIFRIGAYIFFCDSIVCMYVTLFFIVNRM